MPNEFICEEETSRIEKDWAMFKKTRSALSDLEHNINDFKNEPLNTLTREESLEIDVF